MSYIDWEILIASSIVIGVKVLSKSIIFLLWVTFCNQSRLIPYDYSLFIHLISKTHLVSITFLWVGLGTNSHTLFLSNRFISSCITSVHFESWRASSADLSFIWDRKLLVPSGIRSRVKVNRSLMNFKNPSNNLAIEECRLLFEDN